MSFYGRRAWHKQARQQALHDAQHRCQRCGCSLIGLGRGAHVHHRKDLRRAPALGLEPLNLVALCRPCHSLEHQDQERKPMCNIDESPSSPDHPWFEPGGGT